ncbi:hypothetical protein ACFLU6_10395 [Acidobacteriota bacterium]
MAEPVQSRPNNQRFLGNCDPDNMEVHDLNNEKSQCQIDEIISAGHAVVFTLILLSKLIKKDMTTDSIA